MTNPTTPVAVNYEALLDAGPAESLEEVIAYLSAELPYIWRDAYLAMTPRPTSICRIRSGSFEYLYDDLASLEALGEVPLSATAEARLVAVFGRSAPRRAGRSRDDNRLRGFIGRTNAEFGTGWDKGHFIAHSIGGVVDGMEANVFIQRRALNRGWSEEGKVYREMEKYCHRNLGVFCFSRPLYEDDISKPAFVEFGILREVRDLWVKTFDNRGLTARDVAS